MTSRPIIFFIVALLLLISCNTTKMVPKGDALYTGATVKTKWDEQQGAFNLNMLPAFIKIIGIGEGDHLQ